MGSRHMQTTYNIFVAVTKQVVKQTNNVLNELSRSSNFRMVFMSASVYYPARTVMVPFLEFVMLCSTCRLNFSLGLGGDVCLDHMKTQRPVSKTYPPDEILSVEFRT